MRECKVCGRIDTLVERDGSLYCEDHDPERPDGGNIPGSANPTGRLP